jgi:hypothetical protein
MDVTPFCGVGQSNPVLPVFAEHVVPALSGEFFDLFQEIDVR